GISNILVLYTFTHYAPLFFCILHLGTEDIIDEAIKVFRANVLFRTYVAEGGADLLLCYLTVYIGEIIRFLKPTKTAAEARKSIMQISHSQTFPIPGDNGFSFAGFFSSPQTKSESDTIRNYLL